MCVQAGSLWLDAEVLRTGSNGGSGSVSSMLIETVATAVNTLWKRGQAEDGQRREIWEVVEKLCLRLHVWHNDSGE